MCADVVADPKADPWNATKAGASGSVSAVNGGRGGKNHTRPIPFCVVLSNTVVLARSPDWKRKAALLISWIPIPRTKGLFW